MYPLSPFQSMLLARGEGQKIRRGIIQDIGAGPVSFREVVAEGALVEEANTCLEVFRAHTCTSSLCKGPVHGASDHPSP